LLISPLVTLNTYCTARKEDREGLCDIVIEPGGTDLMEVDGVRVLEDLDLLSSNWSKNANGEPWSGERMPLDERGRDTQQTS
jgi:hypothetical protein